MPPEDHPEDLPADLPDGHAADPDPWPGFLDRLADGRAWPGVGAAAAHTAAMAAAVVEMALARGPGREAAERERARERARALRRQCVDLAAGDARAYAAYVRERTPAALAVATEVPCTLAETCASIDVLAVDALRVGNRKAAADVRGAQRLARAALSVARDIARVNLGALRDEDRARALRARLAILQPPETGPED